MKSYHVNNSAKANFGFFLTPFPENHVKSFPAEHKLLEDASQLVSDKLREFKIRSRTLLPSLAVVDSEVISSVKNFIEEYVNTTTEEVRQASPLISQFLGDNGNSAMYSYAYALVFVGVKKYDETIEYKKSKANGEGKKRKRDGARRH